MLTHKLAGLLIVFALAIGVVSLMHLVTSAPVSADIHIAGDDYEDHLDGPSGFGWLDEWEFSGNAGYTDSDDPHSGTSHLQIRGRNSSAVRVAEVTGESSLVLKLWARAESLDNNRAVLEVSNNGRRYRELTRWNSQNDDGPYVFFEFDLAEVDVEFDEQVWVRVRIRGGSRTNGELFIDDIEIVNASEDPDPIPDPNTPPITLDSLFGEWPGKAHLADAFGDQSGSSRNDIAAFYWANNIDEEVNFHMLERHTKDGKPFDGSNGQPAWVRYIVYVDTNNNGNYSDSGDRRAVVTYVPTRNRSLVNVKVYPADSFRKISNSGWNDWGESRREGGLKVEFAIDWEDLGIEFGSVIRMYAVSFTGLSISPHIADRVPDGNADIQWSPASVLGPWLLGAASVAGIGVIWFLSRRRKLWT